MSADAEKTPATAPPRTPRRRAWPAIALVLIASAFVGGVLAVSWPRLTDTGDADRIAALERRVAQLNATLEAAQGRIASSEDRLNIVERNTPGVMNAGTGATLDQRVTTVETANDETTRALAALVARLNSVEAATPPDLPQRLQGYALKDEQEAIDARVRQLEGLKNAATLLALARVARAAEASQPFEREFEVLASVAPTDPTVAVLRPLAARSVPSRATLAAGFPDAARNAINAERASTATSFWDRFSNGFVRLIGWRRVGDIPGDSTEARLARAQAALDRSDLAAAAGQLNGIAGPAGNALALWRGEAEARLTLERAIAEMDRRVLEGLAQPVPAAPPQ